VECHFGADETGGAGDEGFHRSEVFDRINRIYRIYRAGAKRRQPEAIFRIGSQGSAVALRAMAGQGGGACQESVGRGSAAGTLSRMVQP
jgi:hypothetical protein